MTTPIQEIKEPTKFERGQVWSNPDDEIMMVVNVRDTNGAQKVHYITQDGERGSFYSDERVVTDNIELVCPALTKLIEEVERLREERDDWNVAYHKMKDRVGVTK